MAFFLGWLGVHRFYLGQVGLGIFYFFLMFTGISFLLGFIDFIVFLSMDEQIFNHKYNRRFINRSEEILDTDFTRRRRYGRSPRLREYNSGRRKQGNYRKTRTAPKKPTRKSNPFKKSGIDKFKDFDYEGAVEDWNKALGIDARDVSVHFNLACAYSLLEQKEEAFRHLDKAVANGFTEYERINSHDALAFIRIQDEFDTFVQNGYRLNTEKATPPTKTPETQAPDLLEQLRQLGELREKGLLTEEEFSVQKKKLLDRS